MPKSYPLDWPEGFPRSKGREYSRFKTGVAVAMENVERSLRLFGKDSDRPITDPILSSNVNMLVKDPSDPGVAVWFIWDGMQICIPSDRYATVAANLQALHHIIEAERQKLRHGSMHLIRAGLRGFLALPSPKHWSEILGVAKEASLLEIEKAWKAKARAAHPDMAGGSHEAMAELNKAFDRACQEKDV